MIVTELMKGAVQRGGAGWVGWGLGSRAARDPTPHPCHPNHTLTYTPTNLTHHPTLQAETCTARCGATPAPLPGAAWGARCCWTWPWGSTTCTREWEGRAVAWRGGGPTPRSPAPPASHCNPHPLQSKRMAGRQRPPLCHRDLKSPNVLLSGAGWQEGRWEGRWSPAALPRRRPAPLLCCSLPSHAASTTATPHAPGPHAEEGVAKIGDVGMVRAMGNAAAGGLATAAPLMTPLWAAPEVLRRERAGVKVGRGGGVGGTSVRVG